MFDIKDLDDALLDSNVIGFLKAIRLGEGTLNIKGIKNSDEGYRVIVGGGRFLDFSKHPAVRIYLPKLDIYSTAAGAYQIIKPTWATLCSQYGFTDFSPLNQDRAAVALISGRMALRDVKMGDLVIAVNKCSKEWASLPGSRAGQRTEKFDSVKETYLTYGGRLKGE